MSGGYFEAKGIVKSYAVSGKACPVLRGINLRLERGQITALLGPSGCGKSTLVDILAGFAAPDAGQVLLEGEVKTRPGPSRAVVFQADALFAWLTARENVTLGLKALGLDKRARRERAMAMLGMVGLGEAWDKLPGEMSGGMRQRLALARVLALSPKVLLMDEPFAALDAITREQMHALLTRLHAAMGTTIFFVTHDIGEAVLLADHVLVMEASSGTLAGGFCVPSKRPRDREAPELAGLRRKIKALLREGYEGENARAEDAAG